MNDSERSDPLRALLGDVTDAQLRAHRERMTHDDDYRARADELAAMQRALLALEPPALPAGLDERVLAALRASRRNDTVAAAMRRQFWRVAVPAAAAATIFFGLSLHERTETTGSTAVSLAAWYPLSADPTAHP